MPLTKSAKMTYRRYAPPSLAEPLALVHSPLAIKNSITPRCRYHIRGTNHNLTFVVVVKLPPSLDSLPRLRLDRKPKTLLQLTFRTGALTVCRTSPALCYLRYRLLNRPSSPAKAKLPLNLCLPSQHRSPINLHSFMLRIMTPLTLHSLVKVLVIPRYPPRLLLATNDLPTRRKILRHNTLTSPNKHHIAHSPRS